LKLLSRYLFISYISFTNHKKEAKFMYKEAYEEAIEALSNSIGDIDNVINYYLRDELDQDTKNELLQTIQTLELLIKKFQNKAQSL